MNETVMLIELVKIQQEVIAKQKELFIGETLGYVKGYRYTPLETNAFLSIRWNKNQAEDSIKDKMESFNRAKDECAVFNDITLLMTNLVRGFLHQRSIIEENMALVIDFLTSQSKQAFLKRYDLRFKLLKAMDFGFIKLNENERNKSYSEAFMEQLKTFVQENQAEFEELKNIYRDQRKFNFANTAK